MSCSNEEDTTISISWSIPGRRTFIDHLTMMPMTREHWVDKEGEWHEVKLMQTSYLLNVARMIRRYVRALRASRRLEDNTRLTDDGFLKRHIMPWPTIMKELERRGLSRKGSLPMPNKPIYMELMT